MLMMRGAYCCPNFDPTYLPKPKLLMPMAKRGKSLVQQPRGVSATGENSQGLLCRMDDILSDPWAN
jgi:hypothetical protein